MYQPLGSGILWAMGLIRKTLSISTLGAVDFRSDKERTAAYTKAAKREAKKQTRLMKDQAQSAKRAAVAQEQAARASAQTPSVPVPPPPGWYPESDRMRWWDGSQWTDHYAPSA